MNLLVSRHMFTEFQCDSTRTSGNQINTACPDDRRLLLTGICLYLIQLLNITLSFTKSGFENLFRAMADLLKNLLGCFRNGTAA